MLEGGTRRQNVQKIMDRFNVSIATAEKDYSKGQRFLQEEQAATRPELLNQIQALRLATVKRALKRNNLQVVATLLSDIGAVIGEVAPEQLAAQAPQLNLVIEPPALSNSEQPQLESAEAESVEPVQIDVEPAD